MPYGRVKTTIAGEEMQVKQVSSSLEGDAVELSCPKVVVPRQTREDVALFSLFSYGDEDGGVIGGAVMS